jgi:hypothetical protein
MEMVEQTLESSLTNVFSIIYYGPDGYETYAVDWDYSLHIPNKWSLTYKEKTWQAWEFQGRIDKTSYKVLLESFGLSEKDFTLEQLAITSPAKLAKIGTKNPKSCTIGDKRYASEVKDSHETSENEIIYYEMGTDSDPWYRNPNGDSAAGDEERFKNYVAR